jgi:hypothetical protein
MTITTSDDDNDDGDYTDEPMLVTAPSLSSAKAPTQLSSSSSSSAGLAVHVRRQHNAADQLAEFAGAAILSHDLKGCYRDIFVRSEGRDTAAIMYSDDGDYDASSAAESSDVDVVGNDSSSGHEPSTTPSPSVPRFRGYVVSEAECIAADDVPGVAFAYYLAPRVHYDATRANMTLAEIHAKYSTIFPSRANKMRAIVISKMAAGTSYGTAIQYFEAALEAGFLSATEGNGADVVIWKGPQYTQFFAKHNVVRRRRPRTNVDETMVVTLAEREQQQQQQQPPCHRGPAATATVAKIQLARASTSRFPATPAVTTTSLRRRRQHVVRQLLRTTLASDNRPRVIAKGWAINAIRSLNREYRLDPNDLADLMDVGQSYRSWKPVFNATVRATLADTTVVTIDEEEKEIEDDDDDDDDEKGEEKDNDDASRLLQRIEFGRAALEELDRPTEYTHCDAWSLMLDAVAREPASIRPSRYDTQ